MGNYDHFIVISLEKRLSFKPVLILIAAIILFEIICTLCAAALAGAANDTENDQAYPLRGEYAVVANADTPDEYIHLLFF